MKSALTVLSYNIHKGFSLGRKRYVLTQIKDALKKVPADLVFLQEVSGGNSQFEFLADQLWPHHAYGKNAVSTRDHHGNAILSRYPIVSYENVNISTNPFERRGLLHAEVDVPGLKAPLHCINVHFDLLHRGRATQVQRLSDRINSLLPAEAPVIIAGDFNDWPGKLTTILERTIAAKELFKSLKGKHAITFPSNLPVLTLDRIYMRGFKPKHAQVLAGHPWNGLSDHLPVVGEFEWLEIKQ